MLRSTLSSVILAIAVVPAVASVAQAAPERSDMPVTYHDLRYAEKIVNTRLRNECKDKVDSIEPKEIEYRCGPPGTHCHAGDSVPWSPSTGVCYGHIEAMSKIQGFPVLYGEINVLFKKYLEDGEVVYRRLPWEGIVWSHETSSPSLGVMFV